MPISQHGWEYLEFNVTIKDEPMRLYLITENDAPAADLKSLKRRYTHGDLKHLGKGKTISVGTQEDFRDFIEAFRKVKRH